MIMNAVNLQRDVIILSYYSNIFHESDWPINTTSLPVSALKTTHLALAYYGTVGGTMATTGSMDPSEEIVFCIWPELGFRIPTAIARNHPFAFALVALLIFLLFLLASGQKVLSAEC